MALVTVVLAALAPIDQWLAAAAPRAGAEDVIAQAVLPPLWVSASAGHTASDDVGCPNSIVVRWQYLARLPDAWAEFAFILKYSATPAGRMLALAGLRAADSGRYLRLEPSLLRAAALKGSMQMELGALAARYPPGDDRWFPRVAADSLITLIHTGAYPLDLVATRISAGRCIW